MTQYVFIETRDPFESRDTEFVARTAVSLKQRGNNVTVFLVQNGVLAARKNAKRTDISYMSEAGVILLADDFSLKERGIQTQELATGVSESSIDSLVDLLVGEETKAIWH
jgi:sulfur transfer complex TusBCD TusB component (DsrH family)